MQARVQSASGFVRMRPGARALVRCAYVALLVACPLMPQLDPFFWTYPGVEHPWALAVFGALFVLPLIDLGRIRRMANLDVLALAAFALAIGFWSVRRAWPLVFVYAPLVYLALRMLVLSRPREAPATRARASGAPILSRGWLLAGIAVLCALHVARTLDSRASTDIGYASVRGALAIVHGRPVYAPEKALAAKLGYDPHYDTYGPATYEAYIPFALLAGGRTAQQLATLFFDLLTTLLLFLLGRRVRGPGFGVLLSYAWLAFPLSVYADELAANDALVAAALAGALLASCRPARRGAALALAAWSKLGSVALVPLLALHRPPGGRRAAARCAAAFALVSAALFAPALAHSSPAELVTRTFGFQLTRPDANSIWEQLGPDGLLGGASWAPTLGGALRGVCAALAGGLVVVLMLERRPRGTAALAAACAAILIALVACAGYFSFAYVLWFAPLAMLASLAEMHAAAPAAPARAPRPRRAPMRRPRRALPGRSRSPSGAGSAR